MFSSLLNRGVVENDETAMSLFPSLYDDDVESFFTEQIRGEKDVKLAYQLCLYSTVVTVLPCAYIE